MSSDPLDIAIVGMSATFAGADDVQSFWQNIVDGTDCLSEAPDGWGDAYYDPQSSDVSRIYTKMGGFVDRDALFDPSEFGIMPNTVPSADPDHFIGLKLAKDALDDAGYGAPEEDHERTGIILGRATYPNRGYGTLVQHGQTVDQVLGLLKELHPDLEDDLMTQIRDGLVDSLPALGPEMMPNMVPNVLSGRIANRLNLMGPNYLIDAACASTLLALEAASRELTAKNCDMMIAGGLHLIVSPQHFMLFSQLNGLSKSKLSPFGASADGTLLGEGVGLFVLKRLRDAERDGDRIYAVVKGFGSSSDGRAVGLLAPRYEGQRLALQRAYDNDTFDPSSVELIEAHGTGMPLGDQTEIATLKSIFGDRGDDLPTRAIGSVKSMIGHCLPAAGAAGLIKTALALHNKVLPPTICSDVNAEIGIEETSCYVNTNLRPWIHGETDHPRRAAVNAFGFGGINAHILVEEYAGATTLTHKKWPGELIVLSADSRAELLDEITSLAHWYSEQVCVSLADLSYTLAQKPMKRVRLAITVKSETQFTKQLDTVQKALKKDGPVRVSSRAGLFFGDGENEESTGKVAFLFPGEGGQHHDMLSDLCAHIPAARNWFDILDRSLSDECPIKPSSIIFPPPTTLNDDDRKRVADQLFSMEIASATVFTASMAIYDFLNRLGVPSDMMIGHSTGEGAALVASGTISHKDEKSVGAGILNFYKAHNKIVESGVVPRGGLLTVGGVDPKSIIDMVDQSEGRLHLALDNCPNQAVLYGSSDDIGAAAERLKELGGICVSLPFDRGFHTALCNGADPYVRTVYNDLDVTSPMCSVYSCVTADRFPSDAAGIRDLASQQIYSRVRFRETVQRMYDDGARIFIEVGPGGSLTGFVRDSLHGKKCQAMATAIEGRPVLPQILNVVGQMFAHGVPLNLDELFAYRPVKALKLFETAGTKKPLQSKIELDIPLMSLPPETVEAFRRRTSQLDHYPPSPAETTDEVAAPSLVHSSSNETRAEQTTRQSAPTPKPTQQAGTNPVVADPRAQAMHAHFDVMNEFLSSQARIFSLMGLGPNGHVVPDQAVADQGTPPSVQRTEQFQLLGGEGTATKHGHVWNRRLTVDDYAFVRDHTIGCPPSDLTQDLLALPVIPFSVSMEIVAEAAKAFCGEAKVVTRLTDCRGYRWLAFDEGDLSLQIKAEPLPTAVSGDEVSVRVRIFELSQVNGRATQFLAFEGVAHLKAAYPDAPLAGDRHTEAFYRTNYAPDMLYGYPQPENLRFAPMFHGPKFQAVRKIHCWNANAIDADLVVPPRIGFCSDLGASPHFETDPVIVDAASHLIAYWAGERFGVDLSSFPFAALDYRQYAPVPNAGEVIRCRVNIDVKTADGRPTAFEVLDKRGELIKRMPCAGEPKYPNPPSYDFCRLDPSDAVISADFEFVNDRGEIIATLSGWQDRYFTMPHRFYRCRLWPQTEFFSEPWMQQETGAVCRRINDEANEFLEDAWGIWKRVLASLVLSARERTAWYDLPAKGGRRSEWLLGRIASKDAVRQWAAQKYNLQLAPADVEILPDQLGRPTVNCGALSELRDIPVVSITHSKGRIVAAASNAGEPLGIDLSRFEDSRGTELLQKSFSVDELSLLDAVGPSKRSHGLLALWSAKEAAAKALGKGLGGEPRNWLVKDYSKNDGWATVNHADTSYHVKVWPIDDEIFALCQKVGVAH
ncbi:MAG: beta-ketoacyl synthase N-terminal-like domain-containing protein [Pseudomonadota bacterium]